MLIADRPIDAASSSVFPASPQVYHKQALAAGFKEPSAVDADSPPSEVEEEED